MNPLAERVAELAAKGLTAVQIGREIHYTRNAVIGLCRRNAIQLKGNGAGERRARALAASVPQQPGQPAPEKAVAPPRPVGVSGFCRWIEGEVERGVEPGWCGQPVVGSERSWCAAHRGRVYHRVGGGSHAQAAE